MVKKSLAVVDAAHHVQARYGWGLQGERIRKTLMAGDQAHTTHYLYQDAQSRPVVADPRDPGLQLQAEAD